MYVTSDECRNRDAQRPSERFARAGTVELVRDGVFGGDACARHEKEVIDEFVALIPRGTMGRPEEIATAVLFLASNDSSFVNGIESFVADYYCSRVYHSFWFQIGGQKI